MKHRHHWKSMGGGRVELNLWDKTFFVMIYQCNCGEYASTPVDMQYYLDLKETKL